MSGGERIKHRRVNATEGILAGIILLYCVMVAAVNPAFLSVETLFDIVRSSSTAVIVGMGLLLVMLSGG
ncbi:MAG: hypothetical protein LBS00_10650, partial [Synergistaceae bacterium]|nr:hypothetical protein [Synergistaceae bacterium]